MGFQALFKFVKCWRAPDIARETVPSSWGGDGERALAEFQTSARDKQSQTTQLLSDSRTSTDVNHQHTIIIIIIIIIINNL